MSEKAKIAGAEAASSAFGLSHGTPSPPPTWAQKFLKNRPANSVTIPSMTEKKAFFDPASLAIGGGLHLGANVAQKILRNTNFGRRLEQSQFGSGLAHAASGKRINPTMESLMRYGLGPESLVHYDAGRELGARLQHMNPMQRELALKQMGGAIGAAPNLKEAPVVRSAQGGIDRFLKGQKGFMEKHLSTVSADPNAKVPLHHKILAPALGGATAFLAPHASIQLGVNGIRQWIGSSRLGRHFAKAQLLKGARGEAINPVKKFLFDYGVSPAAYDSREIGLAANKDYGELQKHINDVAAKKGYGPVPMPTGAQLTDFAHGVYNKVQNRPGAAVAPAAPPNPGSPLVSGLGRAALVGGGLYGLNQLLKNRDEPQQQGQQSY